MNEEVLEQVMELIDDIADSYDEPDEEQVDEMCRLTGNDWSEEDIQEICVEYWSHHSLEETAYMMFYKEYPPIVDLCFAFWKYKNDVNLSDKDVYEKFRTGKGEINALEILPYDSIIQELENILLDFERDMTANIQESQYHYKNKKQKDFWTNTNISIKLYGKSKNQIQMFQIVFHNVDEKQISDVKRYFKRIGCTCYNRE